MRPGRDGGRGAGREERMVPRAEFRSYYGRPVLKKPRWKAPHMPGYLYLGGLSGASSTMAALADATGRPRLALTGRLTAAAAVAGGAGLLIAELGRPKRVLNMLRVFKPTSPMSVGSWILAGQGGFTMAAAASAVTGIAPGLGRAAGAAAAVTGPFVATYTGVVLADTAVPAWHEAYRHLPLLFTGSSLASGGAIGMIATPRGDAGPARRMALIGAGLELAAAGALERGVGLRERPDLVSEPYRAGRAGVFLRSGRALTVAGAAGAVAAGRSRVAGVVAGLALTGGALCTRFAVLYAGHASAEDPKYTVVPQRERLTTP
ncbi:polysulfide reductase NrfD [Actinoallomurus purpureus]|uniref:NrfD/PsrC family molybdoenzyme membrane anchor subunit n=1 Tax=Actinoallomurus purpureus TaxID=478114 RepID=UPI0020928EF5|nr:NrfD/PsrC family molybdoenzyme membrane anchor subunit [Actinoallomurus purpureus]MCO6007851.1 polysulfide reductase NrfD [Actinoallomurus purpureus]